MDRGAAMPVKLPAQFGELGEFLRENMGCLFFPSADDAPKDVDLTSTDLGDRSEEKPFSTTVTYDTDTATGKKVQIKTEKRYVR